MVRRHPPDWALALMLLAGLYLWQRTAFPAWMVDLFPNQIGAYYFQTGQHDLMYMPITDPEAWRAQSEPVSRRLGNDGELSAFLYPPVVAALLSPFAEYPAGAWRNILFGLNILLIFVIAGQTARLCSGTFRLRGYLWALTLVLWAYPMARAMKLGQIVPVLAAAEWAGLIYWRRGREAAGGIVTGIVAALKLFPLTVMLLPALDRRWKSIVAMLATITVVFGASIAAFGLTVHAHWWTSMRAFGTLANPFFGNQSLSGWISRLAYRQPLNVEIPFTGPLLAASWFVMGSAVAGVTLAVLWRRRGALSQHTLPLSAGLVLSAVMLGIPTAWEHYWLFVLPALGWAVHDTWIHGDHRFWEVWLGVAAFLFLMKLTHFYGDSVIGRLVSGSQAAGMLMFWIWCVRRLWRTPAHAAA